MSLRLNSKRENADADNGSDKDWLLKATLGIRTSNKKLENNAEIGGNGKQMSSTFIDLDDAVKMVYGDAEYFPDEWKNVSNGCGGYVTELTWWPDNKGDNDSHDYIDEEGWSEWACSYFKSYRKAVKIKKTGIVVYDE